jgi:uncharacterized membrane protein YheB (UPF0754 family)
MILIAAVGGWFVNSLYLKLLFKPYLPKKIAGFTLHGVLAALQPSIATNVAAAIARKYLSEERIEQKLNNPAVLAELKPEIERHVDQFLSQKLPVTFPLLSKLMGEKTILKFKDAFLNEIDMIFPVLIKKYSGSLVQRIDAQGLIEQEINAVSMQELKETIYKHTSRQLFAFKLTGAIAGAITGLLQCLALIFFRLL